MALPGIDTPFGRLVEVAPNDFAFSTAFGIYKPLADGTFQGYQQTPSGGFQTAGSPLPPQGSAPAQGGAAGGGTEGTPQCGPGEVWDPETQQCQLVSVVEARARERERIAREEEAKQREREKDLEDPTGSSGRSPSAVFQGLAGFLQSIGLGSLFQYSGGRPSGWLWDQIKSGIETQDELLFALEQTPEFRQRFAVIFNMRAAGRPYIPTAREVLEYEQGFTQLMTSAGVPTWFFDSTEDAQKAMETGLALTQVEDRLQRGYQTMQRMPSEVRDVFNEYYGQSAEGAMLAAILDPTKTLNEIDRSVRVGQIGGFGRRAQFEITRAQAEQFAQIDLTEQQIREGIQESAGLRPLTQETFGERLDLTEQAALEAGLGGSATEAARFANRLRTRQLQQSTVGGGAAVSTQGVTGAGVV